MSKGALPSNQVRIFGFIPHTPKYSIRVYDMRGEKQEVSHLGFWLRWWSRDILSSRMKSEGFIWVKAYQSRADRGKEKLHRYTWLHLTGLLRQTPASRSRFVPVASKPKPEGDSPTKQNVELGGKDDHWFAKWGNRGVYLQMLWFQPYNPVGLADDTVTLMRSEFKELTHLANLAKKHKLHLSVPQEVVDSFDLEGSFDAEVEPEYGMHDLASDIQKVGRAEMVRDGSVNHDAEPEKPE